MVIIMSDSIVPDSSYKEEGGVETKRGRTTRETNNTTCKIVTTLSEDQRVFILVILEWGRSQQRMVLKDLFDLFGLHG